MLKLLNPGTTLSTNRHALANQGLEQKETQALQSSEESTTFRRV